MWRKWIPWRHIITRIARAQGFVDPIRVFSRLQRFAQPSEIAVPVELLRLSAVLHARGLMNALAIQHNLDWVWPYWVERQFDPRDIAFVPRAFSLTHINLTHRNWTAVGYPGSDQYPLADPRGLVTPFYDSWSVDGWVLRTGKKDLIPSRQREVSQTYLLEGNLGVRTESLLEDTRLVSTVEMFSDGGHDVCRIHYAAESRSPGWLAVSLRPYNPEGVSQIDEIALLKDGPGWKVNGKYPIYLNSKPGIHRFSSYHEGDAYEKLPAGDERSKISCPVEMATAAALFELGPDGRREVAVHIPLQKNGKTRPSFTVPASAAESWRKELKECASLNVPDKHWQYLYSAAVHTTILHSPGEVYPGPFTYKHFWFRDAVVILHAMLTAGKAALVESILDSFPSRQTVSGYFRSQEGEWDSNGQVLWFFHRFCELTGKPVKEEWQRPIEQAARWLIRKRLSEDLREPHAGLLPAGFSAEHLGPNDYYYWDDFWGVAGLRAASEMARSWGDEARYKEFRDEAESFLRSIERSLEGAAKRLGHEAMPASPYRRMDTGAIGCLPVDYPLQLWQPANSRVMATVEYLLKECFTGGGFFHDMSHSGINPYLTLHIAQILLRAGDERYFQVIEDLAGLASPTGQWPEAMHPKTRGGCMGDGQHVWAAAEWILMMRSLFLREENEKLILFPGIPLEWIEKAKVISFGPVLTRFGTLSPEIIHEGGQLRLSWRPEWRKEEPLIEIRLPFRPPAAAAKGQDTLELSLQAEVRK